jgi:GNAT superfamily N-acetyltransferase
MEIRRIQEPEAAEVVALWDDMCRAVPDGGPLSERGRRHLERMLAMQSWHEQSFCLVAAGPERIEGFVCATASAGTGLLPGLLGEVEESYARPDAPGGLRRQLVEAAVAALRERGAKPIRSTMATDDPEARQLFERLGFEADMICLSLYRD